MKVFLLSALVVLTGCSTTAVDVPAAPLAIVVATVTPSPVPNPSVQPSPTQAPIKVKVKPVPVVVVPSPVIPASVSDHVFSDVALEASGVGVGETDAFFVEGVWSVEAEWDCPGDDIFEIEVKDVADDSVVAGIGWGPPSPNTGGGQATGTFYISVVDDCSWSLRVIDTPNL